MMKKYFKFHKKMTFRQSSAVPVEQDNETFILSRARLPKAQASKSKAAVAFVSKKIHEGKPAPPAPAYRRGE